jgi:hypothetical protein
MQTINMGTTPNDRTGDSLYVAFNKVNDNFVELYGLSNNTKPVREVTDSSGEQTIDMLVDGIVKIAAYRDTILSFTNIVPGREIVVIITAIGDVNVSYGTDVISTDGATSTLIIDGNTAILKYYSTGVSQSAIFLQRN